MLRRSLSLVVLACAALFSGCDGNPLEPDASGAIRELHLSPVEGTLFTIGTPGTLQLTVTALNNAGELMDVFRAVTFASGAAGVAIVDERGVVTAVAPGTAEITATVTTGQVTRSASMTVTVIEPPAVFVSGTYDVEAREVCCTLTTAGESLRNTGVFTFLGASGTDGVIGTVTDWQLRTLAGEPLGGPISGTIVLTFSSGRPYLQLFFPTSLVFLTFDGSSDSDTNYSILKGDWWENGGWGSGGTYTAIRRAQ